ncbi:hypothetical protein DFH08DRAFT_986302 [Mycena albidolilacea]|uniref:Uncharacterized protein n=1 Tax=Mycena albidolilacea TaxID=1033008 RepID=A0AAD6Z1X5_9AGAR|nr:hypothetical protein DFH08DRAFT_993676 [Mycena albidolilacea]KAJ7303678.1 hypothetical protein DFH08DRAFT_986302 [Mycena albidolilacea]
MALLNSPAPGTESSVPGAVNDQTVAALQSLWAAMQQAVTTPPAPLAANSVPAITTPSTAAPPVIPTSSTAAPSANALPTGGPWVAGTIYHVVPPTPLVPTLEGENESEGPWYSITRGLHVGVTLSNPIAVGAIAGVSRSAMAKHKTQAQAIAAFNEALNFGLVAVLHP